MIATETSKDISVNGIRVTCYSDGSIEVHVPRSKGRTFGCTDNNGYVQHTINSRSFKIHELIARGFLGSRPRNHDVDHIDGDKLNNAPSNLRYVTRSQNLRGSRKITGNSQYRGVHWPAGRKKCRVRINVGKGKTRKRCHLGYFDDEKEAAIARDTFCYEELNYPLEGLNFPELFVDKEDTKPQVTDMQNNEENIERIQTQIDMIRQESRLLSYRIDRMTEQRKTLQDEKRNLKEVLIEYKKP